MSNDTDTVSDQAPPKWVDLFGIAPTFTGGLDADEYLAWSRGEPPIHLSPDDNEYIARALFREEHPGGDWDAQPLDLLLGYRRTVAAVVAMAGPMIRRS